jgi:hypothetical protein
MIGSVAHPVVTECENLPPPVAERAIDALTSLFHEWTALP